MANPTIRPRIVILCGLIHKSPGAPHLARKVMRAPERPEHSNSTADTNGIPVGPGAMQKYASRSETES
jgi:hypothetical protein